MEAGKELGYEVRDPNPDGPLQSGFSPTNFHVKNGNRWNIYDGFLKPAMERNKENLKVLKFSHVYKILFDNSNKALGVKFLQHGKVRKAIARKEVILSAGSIQSGKLLMLSGIGPKNHLMDVGIKPRVDLPVGEIMQDKYGAMLGPFLIDEGYSFRSDRDINEHEIMKWLTNGKGTLSTPQVEGLWTITSDFAIQHGKPDALDIHTYVIANSITSVEEKMFRDGFNIKPEGIEYLGKSRGFDSFLQFVTISKPYGTGTMRLASSDPFDDVLLNPKYLHDKRDVQRLVEGLKFATKLVEETESFKKINGRLIPLPYPGCEDFEFKSDAYWECLGRHTTITAYKYAATAPMGNPNDPQTVVDSRLRVLKTKNLRVIDNSVIQERIVSINQNTCMMIGRLAADFLIKEWKSKE